MKKTILKNTSIVSVGTNLSRALGLIRDIFIAKFFGTSVEAGAFVVAFTLPNLLRDTIGEGAANAAFVPVLTDYKVKNDKQEMWKAAAALFNVLVVALMILTAIGVVIAPLLVKIAAPGFVKDQAALTMTINLTRMMFPYIFFMGMTAYFMGLLNTLGYFWVPAFSNSLLNVSLIACIVIFCPHVGVFGLAIGVLIGGLAQFLVHIPVLKKAGFVLSRRIELKHPAVKKAGVLLAPRVAGTTIYQVNVIVDRMLASLSWIVGTGGIPALYFSYRLIQYPISIFSTALATAVLPVMSHHFSGNDHAELKKVISFAMRSVFLVMIPASIGLIALGKPIIKIIYEHGAFSNESTRMTYITLVFYSIGLFAYGGIKILATCFYSMGDTRTPVKTAALSLVVNLAAALTLMFPFKIGGIALATSISAIFNFTMLYTRLSKKINMDGLFELVLSLRNIVIASIGMAIFASIAGGMLAIKMQGMSIVKSGLALIFIMILSSAIYLASAKLLKIEEAEKLIKWILKKR